MKKIFIALTLILSACNNYGVKNFKEAYLINKNENYTKRKKIFILDNNELSLLNEDKNDKCKINGKYEIFDLEKCLPTNINPLTYTKKEELHNNTGKKYIYKNIKGNKLLDIIVEKAKENNIELEYDSDDNTLKKYNKNKRHLFIEGNDKKKKLCINITSEKVAEVILQIRKFIYMQNKRQNKEKDDIYKAVGLENIKNKENILKQILKDEIEVHKAKLIKGKGWFGADSSKKYYEQKKKFNVQKYLGYGEIIVGSILNGVGIFVTLATVFTASPISIPVMAAGIAIFDDGFLRLGNNLTQKEIVSYEKILRKIQSK